MRESTKFASKYFNGKTNVIVEVGVGDASNAFNMIENLNPNAMYLVDPFVPPEGWPNYDYNYKECQANKGNVEVKIKDMQNVHLIVKESHKATEDIPNDLDLVYIDAIHDEFNVTRDIECWLQKIRVGGILCGHDYYADAVALAVIKKFPDIRKSPYEPDRHRNAEGSDWWIVKK